MASKNIEHLKSSLVKTRKIIAKKLKKVHNDRVDRERDLGEKYTPITDSLSKLIESKRNNQVDEKTHFEPVVSGKREINQIKREPDSLNGDNIGINTSVNEYRSMDVVDDWNDLIETQNDAMKAAKRKKRFKENNHPKKKCLNVDADSDVENPDEVSKLKQSEMKKRKKKCDLKNLHDMKLAGSQKNLKNIEKKKERESKLKTHISPEDYDDLGNFRGAYKPKRRKIESSRIKYKYNFKPTAWRKYKLKKFGRGLDNEFIPYTQNIVYEYFDDPNELCERLKLLVSSRQAGNSNHSQEINSILEELRELNIVK